jgi:hypothetical protein
MKPDWNLLAGLWVKLEQHSLSRITDLHLILPII